MEVAELPMSLVCSNVAELWVCYRAVKDREEVETRKIGRNETRTFDFSGIVSWVHSSEQETRKRARHKCFVSHETGLAGGLYVSVSQVETKHLDFQGFFRVSFQFRPSKKVQLKKFF